MPFARGDSVRTITEGLAWVVKTCELQGLLKLFDSHVLAQHFFCRLLNTVYRFQLKQMDQIQANYPAIDLGDSVNRKAYQITTEKRGEKVQDTLDKFVKHKLPAVYDALRILVIGERQGAYKTVMVPAGLNFDCDRDIVGVAELVKYIETLETAHLEEVAAVFHEELVKARPGRQEVPTPDLMPEAQEMLIDACAAEAGEKGKIVWTLIGDGWIIRSGTAVKHLPHLDREAQARWQAAIEQLTERKLVDLTMTRTGLGGNLLGWYTVRHEGCKPPGNCLGVRRRHITSPRLVSREESLPAWLTWACRRGRSMTASGASLSSIYLTRPCP